MGAKASLIVLFVLCVIFAIARSDRALTTAGGRDVVEITFWNGFTGPDGRVMLGLVRQFNQTDGAARVTAGDQRAGDDAADPRVCRVPAADHREHGNHGYQGVNRT